MIYLTIRLDLIKQKCKQATCEDEGLMHLFQCNGQGIIDDGRVAWVSVWLAKKLPRGFDDRRSLCGYCAAQEVEDLKGKLEMV